MGFDAVHVGIDIGKMSDPTGIVAVQVLTAPQQPTRYVVQYIERVPLGTSYPDVATHCIKVFGAIQALLNTQYAARRAALVEQVRMTGQQIRDGQATLSRVEIRVFMDVTGVGRPVFDMIERMIQAEPRLRAIDLCPVTFIHGETYQRKTGRMGKAYMVSRLQALLQSRLVQLPPRHPEAQAMVRELKDYEIHIDANATDTYGAFRVGTHDDLVTALGLAVLEDPATLGARLRFFDE